MPRKMLAAVQSQTRREGGVGGKLPQASQSLGAAPSLCNTKYTRINHYFEKNF